MIKEVTIRASEIEGVTEISAAGWDGRVLKMSREVYEKWRVSGKKPLTPIVYVLYADHFDRARHGNELYVGHTSDAQQRIDQHMAGKAYWSVVIMFSSDADWMNVAFTQNIECTFIEWAKHASRYEVKNGTDSAFTHLGESDTLRLNRFLEGVRPTLKIAGIDIFEPNLDGAFSFIDTRSWARTSAVIRIEKHAPECILRIQAGSIFRFFHDTSIVAASSLPGVVFNAEENSHTFTQDVLVPANIESYTSKFLDYPTRDFKNVCGVSLADVLKKLKSD